ncbi:MAG: ATP-dependent RecD-like DNA helicase [Lachnospiraceae bacterium]|nr:ATP-dependent RecD-like DNA helicase [Lachnospiraceae bacterium]
METLSGYIKHIIFSNPDNGYTVFELATDTDEITCVGALHAAAEGEYLKLGGKYVMHDLYGRQFSFSEYEITQSEDETDILRYLSSGIIKGIGPALAKRIVDAFSSDTFRVMEEEPEMLAQIKGISLRKAQEIGAAVSEIRDVREVMLFLQKFSISNNLANRIYRKYGGEVYEVMEKNPYRLAEDIEGIGFATADEIARASGFDADSAFRVRCGISYTLSSAVSEGHTYLPMDMLIVRSTELLGVGEEFVRSECDNMVMEKKIIAKVRNGEARAYLPAFYRMETVCAKMLHGLDVVIDPGIDRIREKIKELEDESAPLEDKQADAAAFAISNGVSVITGGPGTGKTTIINVLIKYLRLGGEDFVLAAPTGRAAKRMTEATGYESYTVQRLLGLSPSGEGRGFTYEYDEDNPLEVDTVIIDEMSMVDLPLMKALVSALVPGTRLIMVGDTDQLPSVGPGSVLSDIIGSGCFTVVRLDKIFRQEEASDIVINAHLINAGIVPKIDNKSRDFFMLKRSDVDTILNNIVKLVSEKLPGYVDAEPFDIQVLTPMRKGPLGVESLNPILQRYLNPPSANKREKEYGGILLREGDKIMQIRNNYQLEWEVPGKYGIPVSSGLGVFNGDMGKIKSIDETSETIEVVYEEDHRVRYPFSGLDELELAYAVTIHKSQGSEYPAVVLPLLSGPRQLMSRNLLYTAVTRARKCVVIVGREETVAQMTANSDVLKRYTSLDEAISEIGMLDGY